VASIFGVTFCTSAEAIEVFDFTFATTGRVTYESHGPYLSQRDFDFPWHGTMSVQTSSGEDGVYRGDDLVKMSFSANPGSGPFNVDFVVYGDPAVEPGCNRFFECRPSPAVVTIADGQIIDIQLAYSPSGGAPALFLRWSPSQA
jgi:hypothetical protein